MFIVRVGYVGIASVCVTDALVWWTIYVAMCSIKVFSKTYYTELSY